MKAGVTGHADDKKGHICPPSNATHPSDRWEALFVYSFMRKFTNLCGKDGLNTPMDFEDALLQQVPNPAMTHILSKFVMNLKPQTRNTSQKDISATTASVLSEYFKTSERTLFWDDEHRKNVDPFPKMTGDFFGAPWDLKLKLLRVLVELQLTHSVDIKAAIDKSWGLTQMKEKRKGAAHMSAEAHLPADHELAFAPIGQDISRKRYWVVDDSPRIWTSTNPWKISAGFTCISSTREDYVAAIDRLKASAPLETKATAKMNKQELGHLALIKLLEERIEKIDIEIARIGRARKKAIQKQVLMAQAELRETRTRRQTRRPNYVDALDDEPEEDDGDNYKEQPGDDIDDPLTDDDGASSSTSNLRRSSRAPKPKANGNDIDTNWRGERRSSRLGAPDEMQMDEPPKKRARTVDSVASEEPSVSSTAASANGAKDKGPGAVALKATETAVEQVVGKKKSKFWFYAVEPVAGQEPPPPPSTASSVTNGDHLVDEDDHDTEMQDAAAALKVTDE